MNLITGIALVVVLVICWWTLIKKEMEMVRALRYVKKVEGSIKEADESWSRKEQKYKAEVDEAVSTLCQQIVEKDLALALDKLSEENQNLNEEHQKKIQEWSDKLVGQLNQKIREAEKPEIKLTLNIEGRKK